MTLKDPEVYIPILWRVIKDRPNDFQAHEDLLYMSIEAKKVGLQELGTDTLREFSRYLEKRIPRVEEEKLLRQLFSLHKRVLLANARDDFESFVMYIEWNRDPKKAFYRPRRKVLKTVVQGLQDLADDKLDILGVSLPPGTGKTTLAIFYLVWLAGKYPDDMNLTGSHSNSFIRGVYDECLRLINDTSEYLWHDVFPEVQIAKTNAKDCCIDLGKSKRFETLEFTSIGTGNAGRYRANRLLYCDDLVSGIEVALSKERLDKLWEIYTTDLKQRTIGDVFKELHIATRWSVHDVVGRLERANEGNPRARFINIPALDENDESNFDYDYGVGFSTAYYHAQRDIMDELSWNAVYMGKPVEREGLLYHSDELKRYTELPQQEPDAIISVCDTKDSGKDFCVMPVAYKYGDLIFIEKFICDNSGSEILEERLANILIEQRVQLSRFESNNAGGVIARHVQEKVLDRKGFTSITTKFTTKNKETRIIVSAGMVKDRCVFKDEEYCKKDREYRKAMDFLLSYSQLGKNAHDDVPDAMAALIEFDTSLASGRVVVRDRPF